MVALPAWLGALGAHMREQVLGTLVAPGSTISIGALAVTLGLLALLTVARRGRPVPARVLARALLPRRLWRSASGRTDIGWFVLSLLFSGAALGWALLSSEAIATTLGHALGPAPAPRLPPALASALLTMLLWLAYELGYWIDHWLSHRVRPLWAFHKVHHSADSLSLLTNFRIHPVDTIKFYNITALAMGTAAALFGHVAGGAVRAGAIGGTNLLIYLSALGVTHLQHSRLWVRFGARGGRWLLGPAHHQIHHSADPRHFDRNFGASLAIWDRLFGTFHLPAARREVTRFGVEGLAYEAAEVARGAATRASAPWKGKRATSRLAGR